MYEQIHVFSSLVQLSFGEKMCFFAAKNSRFFLCGSNEFGFTMNLDAPNEESIRSVAYVESLSLTESLFLIFPPNSTYD